MNKQLRRLGAGLLACYLALFAMVNYVQVFHANDLNENALNSRKIVRDFNRPRGQIIAQASRDKDEVLTADLDLDMIGEVRKTWQFFRDRRPESYGEITAQSGRGRSAAAD